MSEKSFLVIREAPESYSVIAAKGDSAEIFVRGVFEEDLTNDNELPMSFSQEHLYMRVVEEESGALAAQPVRLPVIGDAFEAKMTLPVGGPYLLDFYYMNHEAEQVPKAYPLRACRPRHFFVGDIYIIAGQSNAAGMGMGALYEPMQLGVQLLRDLTHWDIASAPFSDFDYSKQSMFLHFAKILYKETGRPIGLIPGAVGGAPLSRFLPEERGDLYEKMLDAMKKHSVSSPKAVLWYQGCTDAGNGEGTENYLRRFEGFVSAVRADFEAPNLPIYTFQLNRHMTPNESSAHDRHYDQIREAQRQATERIRGVSVLPAIDGISMADAIHGSKITNLALGERLARAVLHDLYQKGEGVEIPAVASAELSGRALRLSFKGVASYLYDFGCGVRHLPIKVTDTEGEIPIESYALGRCEILLSLSREAVGACFVSAQTGSDPRFILADFLSGMPLLCFSSYPVSIQK